MAANQSCRSYAAYTIGQAKRSAIFANSRRRNSYSPNGWILGLKKNRTARSPSAVSARHRGNRARSRYAAAVFFSPAVHPFHFMHQDAGADGDVQRIDARCWSRRIRGKRRNTSRSSPWPSLPKSTRQGNSMLFDGQRFFTGVRPGHIDMDPLALGLVDQLFRGREKPGKGYRSGPFARPGPLWGDWRARRLPARASADIPNAAAQRKTAPRLAGSWTVSKAKTTFWRSKSISRSGISRTAMISGGVLSSEIFSSTGRLTSQVSPTVSGNPRQPFFHLGAEDHMLTVSGASQDVRDQLFTLEKKQLFPARQQFLQAGVGCARIFQFSFLKCTAVRLRLAVHFRSGSSSL